MVLHAATLMQTEVLFTLNGVVICMLQETGGEYGIALNERHFEELVFGHARPPPSLDSEKHASLVSMRRMMHCVYLGISCNHAHSHLECLPQPVTDTAVQCSASPQYSLLHIQVRMGFAHRNPDGIEGTAYIGEECKLSTGGFTCPR